jgi:Mrp family chromosome partitioning ATPase
MDRSKKTLYVAGHNPPDVFADEDKDLPVIGDELAAFQYSETRIIDVPPATLRDARVLTSGGQDPVTQAYKLLRTQVLQRMAREGWQTIGVVSPSAGDGKTLTAINLAISIASSRNHTALLVDLDWRHPAVHTYFGYSPDLDVCDYLSGKQHLSDVLVNPGVPRFCFLPCARPVPESSEHLAGLGPFVRELKGRYRGRVVLFDMPPLFATDDALSFLPFVDCVLLVVQESKTQADDVERSLELLGPERLLGSVINKSRHTLPRY